MIEVGRKDYREVPGAKQVIDTWVRNVGLDQQWLIGIEETVDPYVVLATFVQRGWDGKPMLNDQGHEWLSSTRITVRRPFPFHRIVMLRRLSDEGSPDPRRTIQQCIIEVQNGGDPFAAESETR